MRRSICYCEPSLALAGQKRIWKFIYTPSTNLPKGTKIKFDLNSKGREIDWETPSVNSKKDKNLIYLLTAEGKMVAAKEIFVADSYVPQYEFTLTSAVSAGSVLAVIMGPKISSLDDTGTGTVRTQTISQRRKQFFLYTDTSGKGRYGEPEVFHMDIKGGALANIKVLTPSCVIKNKRFDITVRFEDEFGNLTSLADDETLLELTHEHLRENLSWKLFVPEIGFITLPNLYFNEEGFYTIKLFNPLTKETFYSSPIRCYSESNQNIYWGSLHGESERFDSTESIESCLRHFRDDKAYNFYAVTPFESEDETPTDLWKQISQNVSEFNENERFTTFLGVQWAGEIKSEGLRQIIFAKENKAIIRKKDQKYSSLKKLYKCFSPKEIISIPSFTMSARSEFNFADFAPEYERVVEIYNAWGSSELTKKEGNTLPIESEDKSGTKESVDGSVQKALNKNLRFGFVAGGLDDRGIFADLYDSKQIQYTSGYTAIISVDHSREALIDALYNRSCYATTGQRIIVGLYIAGVGMGKEISTASKPGLRVNRHIHGYAAGTATLKCVEIIRNGKIIKSFDDIDGYSLDFTLDDMDILEKVCITASNTQYPFAYYYLRVTQEDGHIAWSSPIWVDLLPTSANIKPKLKSQPTKAIEKAISLDEDFDDDLDEDEFSEEE